MAKQTTWPTPSVLEKRKMPGQFRSSEKEKDVIIEFIKKYPFVILAGSVFPRTPDWMRDLCYRRGVKLERPKNVDFYAAQRTIDRAAWLEKWREALLSDVINDRWQSISMEFGPHAKYVAEGIAKKAQG